MNFGSKPLWSMWAMGQEYGIDGRVKIPMP